MRGARARGVAGRAGVQDAQAWQERVGRPRWGVLLGQLAVHSVHTTCFWPGLTRYFSGVIFLDIVREHCSSQKVSKKKLLLN